jgi:hypothetical protein
VSQLWGKVHFGLPRANGSEVELRNSFPAWIAIAALAWPAAAQAPGHPNLEGYWTNVTLTPFERPREFIGKQFFTASEAAAFVKKARARSTRNSAFYEAWLERATGLFPTRRTSIVIDPPDGRIPPLTPQAQRAEAAREKAQQALPSGPEALDLPVRCLLWPTAGPPMVAGPYNSNYQIVQTPSAVAIHVEMIHDVRIVALDRRAHLDPRIRLWLGDSIGHWEGGTLVVDTANFTDKTHFRGSDRNLHLVEQFTRTGPNSLRYQFTVDDPTAFTKRWTGEIILAKTAGPIYEYACHEANYSMTNILKDSRTAEKAAAHK